MEKTEGIKISIKIGDAAVKALVQEVYATPKPGLVDHRNNGSHQDMDIRTFERSAEALRPYFIECAQYGIDHQKDDPSQFLSSLSKLGIEAEKAMLEATDGVNTHKGAVFSMGILCWVYGFYYGKEYELSDIQRTAALIALPSMDSLKNLTEETAVTTGQKLYVKYGLGGAREEASLGFPTVFETAYPTMCRLIKSRIRLNDAGVITLIHIMGTLIDTNVIHRSSFEEAEKIRNQMHELSQNLENQDYISILTDLDDAFIERNISPGGSADLLALTYFVCMMEGKIG